MPYSNYNNAMSSQSYLINQPMPLERRQMPSPTSHQSRDHRRHRHSDEDKVDSNMPIETVADCATAASTNNTTEGKGLNLTTSSSFAEKKQIAALMASTATIATEASSVAPSIETTFIAAAAATAQNSTGRLNKHFGDSIASLSLSDLDFAEKLDTDNTQDALNSTNQAQQDKCDEDEIYDSLSETSNNTRDHGIDIENRFLRPRLKELHHYALAMDIVCDIDDEDTDSSDDDTISEPSNHDGSTDEVRGFQAEDDDDDDDDDDEELFLSSLKEGLKFMHRARKSEKHVHALAAFLLDDSDDEDDES